MHRNGLVRAAACAALACAGLGGWSRAEELGGSATPVAKDARLVSSDLSLSHPLYLQDNNARPPLMELLDHVGLAKPLDDAKITVGGLVEGSWTYSASSPPGNIITGRVFDVEHESVLLNQLEIHVERTVDDSLKPGANQKFDIGGRMEWRWG